MAREGPEFDYCEAEKGYGKHNDDKAYLVMQAQAAGDPCDTQGEPQSDQGCQKKPRITQHAQGRLESDATIGNV